jgi:hypothetical protein
LRVNITSSDVADLVAKKPSPVMARSSALPVCSIGPLVKSCVIESTRVPTPCESCGLLVAEAANTSSKFVRLRLKPAVSEFARLCETTSSWVWAALTPLNEV